MGIIRRRHGCVCCIRKYDRRDAVAYTPMDLESMSGIDMGLFELIQHIQKREKEPKKLEPPMAKHVAGFAKARAREAAAEHVLRLAGYTPFVKGVYPARRERGQRPMPGSVPLGATWHYLNLPK